MKYVVARVHTAQQKALDDYIRKLGIPPGPPTQQSIYGTPDYTGMPYPALPAPEAKQNQEPPQGWPRNPKFNDKGDVPGPPAQFVPPVSPETVKAGEGFIGTCLAEQNLYYLHSDHLGSTSYITTQNGSISQHVEYIAFGEVLFEEHSSSFSSPYLYNGKELDRETGLYYYGARYYDPKVSIFVNVDPLVEKTMTSYAYVNNNPVMLVDPDGMKGEDFTILIAKNGAGGHGHMGAVIQDGSGKYFYVTMGATENAGIGQMVSSGVQGGMIVIELIGAETMDDAINLAKEDSNNSPYTNQVTFKTTSEQDQKIFDETIKKAKRINSGKEKYNVLTNNCTDGCQEPIEKATRVKLSGKIIPNSNFDEVKEKQKEIQKDLKTEKKSKPIDKDNNPGALKPWEFKV